MTRHEKRIAAEAQEANTATVRPERATEEPRPPGGREFEAVEVTPEGWLVLAPWIPTPEGHWWRPHLDLKLGGRNVHRSCAEHYARAINEAMRERGDEHGRQPVWLSVATLALLRRWERECVELGDLGSTVEVRELLFRDLADALREGQ